MFFSLLFFLFFHFFFYYSLICFYFFRFLCTAQQRDIHSLQERAHNVRKGLSKLATHSKACASATGGGHLPPKDPPKVCFVMTDAVRAYAANMTLKLHGLSSVGDSDPKPPSESDSTDLQAATEASTQATQAYPIPFSPRQSSAHSPSPLPLPTCNDIHNSQISISNGLHVHRKITMPIAEVLTLQNSIYFYFLISSIIEHFILRSLHRVN